MSVLASEFHLVVDRGVCCVGHGKSIVDAINGTDKNVILRVSMRKVKNAVDAANVDHKKSLKVNVYDCEKEQTVSAANDCKEYLETEYKQERLKRTPKKEGRNIKDRYWHVRKIDAKLNESKYKRIEFTKREGVTFTDFYHFYTCPELGTGQAALRRVPCYCEKCNETLQKP